MSTSWLDELFPDDEDDGDFLPPPPPSSAHSSNLSNPPILYDNNNDFQYVSSRTSPPTLRSTKPLHTTTVETDVDRLPEMEEEFDWDIKSEDDDNNEEANFLELLARHNNNNENSTTAWSIEQPPPQQQPEVSNQFWNTSYPEEDANSDEDSTFVEDDYEDDEDEEDSLDDFSSPSRPSRRHVTANKAIEAEEVELGVMSTRQASEFVASMRLHLFQLIHLIGTSLSSSQQNSTNTVSSLLNMLRDIHYNATRVSSINDPSTSVWSFLSTNHLLSFIERVEELSLMHENQLLKHEEVPHSDLLVSAGKGKFYPYTEKVKILIDQVVKEIFIPKMDHPPQFGSRSKNILKIRTSERNKKAWTTTERDLLILGIKAHGRDSEAISRNYLPHREPKQIHRTICSKWSTERVVMRPVGELLSLPLAMQNFTRDEDDRIMKWFAEGRDFKDLVVNIMPHRSIEAVDARFEFLCTR